MFSNETAETTQASARKKHSTDWEPAPAPATQPVPEPASASAPAPEPEPKPAASASLLSSASSPSTTTLHAFLSRLARCPRQVQLTQLNPLLLLSSFRPTRATLRSIVVLVGLICGTFFFHMYLQHEYYQRCKSNVFRVVLFKQSYMCMHMLNVLTFIENTYFYGIKHVADSVLTPIYNAGMSLNGFALP